MSFSDDSVQSQGDQGGESTAGDLPYAELLNRIPEEFRDQVAPVFKEADAGITRKFQEHADFRKQWEPYQDTGIHQFDPEKVTFAGQLLDAMQNNPAAVWDWSQQFAQENGLVDEPEEAADEFQYEDPSVQQAVQTALAPFMSQLQGFESFQQQIQQQAQVEQRTREIETTLSEIERDHPDEFNRDMIDKLVANYMDRKPADAVKAAFGDWQKIRNDIQKSTLQSKLGMPQAPERGGLADGTPEPVKLAKGRDIWANANRIAHDTFAADRAANQ